MEVPRQCASVQPINCSMIDDKERDGEEKRARKRGSSNLVSSSPKKQAIVARSSMESEYHAFALIALETNWVQQLLLELHISSSMKPVLWCDNLSVGSSFCGALDVRYVPSLD
ncbi:putative mitochondrial protein [Cucumis melo var. makuwa]|uniref:Putative mitochondrial protein n=1 Tax=Cucumis melo var. makuwa TaxID=1194695 RepID=A0A5D3BKP8_CUCMM|nr:putative mitochondrial protein [Cucumis melo var. makuwa]